MKIKKKLLLNTIISLLFIQSLSRAENQPSDNNIMNDVIPALSRAENQPSKDDRAQNKPPDDDRAQINILMMI